MGASCGTKIVAGTPALRAAQATAWPWLPALAATTPRPRSSSVSTATRLTAPRTLNDPVRCRFSAFSHTSRPASCESVAERTMGVSRAIPSSRARARSTSAAVGGANPKHLLEDLRHGAQRIELAPLHRLEHSGQLGIVLHSVLEIRLRPGGRDREHLRGKMLAPPLVEEPVLLEVRAMIQQTVPQRLDALPAKRLGQHDRRLPRPLVVEREDRAHIRHHRLRRRMIGLVDGDHVGDLHDARLQRLDRVARAGHEDEQHCVRHARHLDLALTGADGLDEHDVLAEGVEQEQRLERRLGQAAEVAARAHRADEDARIEKVLRQPDPVAEQRALRERARRIHRDDARRLPELPGMDDKRTDEGRLADPRGAGDADRPRTTRRRVEIVDDARREGVAVLDERDRPGQRAPVATGDPRDEALPCPLSPAGHDTGPGNETGATSRSGASALAERSSRKPTSAPRPAQAPEMANTQRAPMASVSGPAMTIPSPRSAKFVLMITVKTRPRSSSGAPRWTSSEL